MTGTLHVTSYHTAKDTHVQEYTHTHPVEGRSLGSMEHSHKYPLMPLFVEKIEAEELASLTVIPALGMFREGERINRK